MSQPSVSSQIQNLECEYNTVLFNRSNKGVTLTKEGELFYQHILTILDSLDKFKEEISVLKKDHRSLISFGATSTIAENILPDILALLSKTHPEVDFKVKIANAESITQDVLDKKINIGLTAGPVTKYKNLNIEGFWEDELVVVIPYAHRWAARKKITLAELLQESLVTRELGSGIRKVMDATLRERGFEPDQMKVKMELGSTQAIKQVVAAGLGISITFSLTVSNESDRGLFKILKIEDAPVYTLNILTNDLATHTKDELILLELLHDQELIFIILSNHNHGREELASMPCYNLPPVNQEVQEHWQEH